MNGSAGGAGAVEGPAPRKALLIREVLKDMGVKQFDPRVVDQLMEFTDRHVMGVLKDACDYQMHAEKARMDPSDVKLAIQNKLEFAFLEPPSTEVISGIVPAVNQTPLPPISTKAGVQYQSSKFSLTNPNFQLDTNASDDDER